MVMRHVGTMDSVMFVRSGLGYYTGDTKNRTRGYSRNHEEALTTILFADTNLRAL